jgi:hypothetical protein
LGAGACWELANELEQFIKTAAQPVQEPDELTIAYMSGLYDGKVLEREACAKVCDWIQEKAEFHGTDCCKFPTPTDCAHAIRARGQA